MATTPIFKAHNPGCNCCPSDEDEPPSYCYYRARKVMPFLFVSSFRYTGTTWTVEGRTRGSLDGYTVASPLYFGFWTGFYEVTYQYIFEGSKELYGGQNPNGHEAASTIHGTTWTVDAAAGELCPFGSWMYGHSYPTYLMREEDYFDWLSGACYPAQESDALGVRLWIKKMVWMVYQRGQEPNVYGGLSGPEIWINRNYDDPEVAERYSPTPAMYDPDVYWPWISCDE